MNEAPRPLRCAIYTRKSTEEGLQQEFNSLQAQREAGEAYILSQRQAGWIALSQSYDDGGFSGATLERPALKQLLADVEAGRIDCVVVYKVDRLSRSLLDFARLVSVFDRRQVSFVSVTQEFNTTTSIGRLTLNILLSFAQFEREIISERTRDKLGAARRKGKWIGGVPVLGYDVDPRGGRLVINPEEARSVQSLFAIAAECGTLAATLKETNARGFMTKGWTSRGGREHVSKPFRNSTLGALLRNVIYTGSVSHKGTRYPGEHEAIITSEQWEEVNRELTRRAANQNGRRHAKQQSLFLGLIRCGVCDSNLLRTYSSRRGRRHYYYVCPATKQHRCEQRPAAAQELEASILTYLEHTHGIPSDTLSLQHALECARVDSRTGVVTVKLRNGTQSSYRVPTLAGRSGGEVDRARRQKVPRISRVMALAIKLEGLVRKQRVPNYAALARAGRLSRARMSQILALTNLAPAIQEALLFLPAGPAGPDRITEKHLRPIVKQVDWSWQRKLFDDMMKRAIS